MTASIILSEFADRGVIITASGGELRVVAPRGELSLSDKESLRRHKPALLRQLSDDQWSLGDPLEWDAMDVPFQCPRCGETVINVWWDALDNPHCRVCDPPRFSRTIWQTGE